MCLVEVFYNVQEHGSQVFSNNDLGNSNDFIFNSNLYNKLNVMMQMTSFQMPKLIS
jgi:hypothetical protein